MTLSSKADLFSLSVKETDKEMYARIKKNWDCISKPLDSMGKFETLFAQIGSIQGELWPAFDLVTLLIMCADNGVVEEGISQSGQDVTRIVAAGMGKGMSSVCIMSEHAGIAVRPIDIGMNTDEQYEGVKNCKVMHGTNNFAKEAAMSESELLAAISVGIEEARLCKEAGENMIALGEMGIGNTTTSAAVVATLLGIPAKEITGKGSGLSDSGLNKKVQVIEDAIAKYGLLDISDSKEQAFETLRCVGGLDIAGLCGACIGAAYYQIPVILDGVITMAAAVAATRLVPGVKEYLIPSHLGKEPAAKAVAKALAIEPIIHANLALGEGTGAVMLLPLLRQVDELYCNGTRFEQMGVEQYERFEEK